ncbi:MAG: hypothetical protein IPG45_23890 [Deltaproteobacteria bacterium]|jgi:hypothetical protein|nr:hypothetical protein [Deltaproteobacteria bacterium]
MPKTIADYDNEQLGLVRATCLYVATKLGDMLDDVVIIGGLVPSLLIDQRTLPAEVDPHVGTMDLDLGLTLGLLDEGRYHELAERLRNAGFEPDKNAAGKPTRQRWKIEGPAKVTVDFLIQPSQASDQAGKLRNLEEDFAAIIAPGLKLAFLDRERITLDGKTILNENATRDIWVAGPGAFVVLKSLAFENRGEGKDAYDLFYVLRNFGSGVDAVAARLKPLLVEDDATKALAILERDFLDPEGIGPIRVVEFMTGQRDAATQADVVGFVQSLLDMVGWRRAQKSLGERR